MTLARKIRHAGAIFLGRYNCRGRGRLLRRSEPRAADLRTARFSSPLGVYDFQKRTSLIQCSPQAHRTWARSPRCWRTAKA